MIQVREAAARGTTRLSWLDSRHTFSFNRYYDPAQVGFGPLVVINDDRVVAGAGFSTHAHADMEILSFVLDGELEHADSLGSGGVLGAGSVQRMTAGTGIRHSEFNHSKTEPLRFLQVWIEPAERGLLPSWEERQFDAEAVSGTLVRVADPEGSDGALTIHQDVAVWLGALGDGDTARLELGPARKAWVQVATGELDVNEVRLMEGDGAAVSEERALELTARRGAKVVVFDLPE